MNGYADAPSLSSITTSRMTEMQGIPFEGIEFPRVLRPLGGRFSYR